MKPAEHIYTLLALCAAQPCSSAIAGTPKPTNCFDLVDTICGGRCPTSFCGSSMEQARCPTSRFEYPKPQIGLICPA